MFPHDDDLPTRGPEQRFSLGAPTPVPLDLGCPPLGIRPRRGPVLVAPVPEAAPHFDDRPGRAKHDVHRPTQSPDRRKVHPIAKPLSVKQPAKREFRSGVTGALELHAPAHSWGRRRRSGTHPRRVPHRRADTRVAGRSPGAGEARRGTSAPRRALATGVVSSAGYFGTKWSMGRRKTGGQPRLWVAPGHLTVAVGAPSRGSCGRPGRLATPSASCGPRPGHGTRIYGRDGDQLSPPCEEAHRGP